MNIFSTAMRSAVRFCGMIPKHELHLKWGRVGDDYEINSATYRIFRETERRVTYGEPVVLVVGFRLRLIGSNAVLHWLFQRLCILTTPFWSGMKGFRVKLWMVNPATKDYLGIYDWRGRVKAQNYLDYLLPILRFCSVNGTVWAKKLDNQELEKYLAKHASSPLTLQMLYA